MWRGIRERQEPRVALAAAGTLIVAAYAWIPLMQPPSPAAQFGRIQAVYGNVFIFMVYAWAAVLDDLKLDAGDFVGVAFAMAGALTAQFWPWRSSDE